VINKLRNSLAVICILSLAVLLSFSSTGHAQESSPEAAAAKLDPVLKLLAGHPFDRPFDELRRGLRTQPVAKPGVLPPATEGEAYHLDGALRQAQDGAQYKELAAGTPLPASVVESLGGSIDLNAGSPDPTVNVLVRFQGDLAKLSAVGAKVQARIGDVVTANIPMSHLMDLARLPGVIYIEASRKMSYTNDISAPETGAPQARTEFGVSGRDVIVAIIDSGIDFTHRDFRKPDGTTRIKYLLDLSDPGDLDSDGVLDGPDDLGGTLYTEAEINAALADNGRVFPGSDTPKDIPDNSPSGISSTIVVNENLSVSSLAVDVDVSHSYIGDLKVVLRSPSGTTATLHNRAGGDGNDVNGVFVINDFNGQDARGNWILTISDLAQEDTGSLQSWGLRINQVVREEDNVGHGTHVAGTASGNGRGTGGGVPAETYTGMAPEADLIVVKGGRTDDAGPLTSDVVGALAFIDQKAAESGKPYVVNMSLGTHIGPHDGTSTDEQAIDGLVGSGKPGKAIVVSAGNEGDEHTHASGQVPQGGTNDVSFEVSRPTLVLVDVWYAGSDTFGIGFRDPTGAGLDPTPILPGGDACYAGGSNRVCIISKANNPNNGDKEISLLFFAVTTGRWRFILHSNTVVDGHFDAWIQGAEFSTDVDDRMRIGMPGTARNAITVGAYVTKDQWTDVNGILRRCTDILSASTCAPAVGDLAAFSSDGPTRDGRQKPEITAPGQMIASSYSAQAQVGGRFSMFPSDQWVVQDSKHGVSLGTSFSAPHVTGAVALLFELNQGLNATEMRDLLTRHARTNSFTGAVPNNRWGYGKLDVLAAAQEISPIACYDFDGDGVGESDVRAVAGRWHQAAEPPYDPDGDGIVTIVDIMQVAAHWGETCQPGSPAGINGLVTLNGAPATGTSFYYRTITFLSGGVLSRGEPLTSLRADEGRDLAERAGPVRLEGK